MQQGAALRYLPGLEYCFSVYFQKCGELRKAAPHILPDLNDREIRLIANIPEKLTPYVKELRIRWVGASKCFNQAWQSETCPPSLFCETASFFHHASRGWWICEMAWWGGNRRGGKLASCTASSTQAAPGRYHHWGSATAPTLLPDQCFISSKGTADLSEVNHVQMCLTRTCWTAAISHGKVTVAKETFQCDQAGCAAFMFSILCSIARRKRLWGHKLWHFMLNTLSSWGSGQLQQ